MDLDRNLLFGVLALQTDLIDHDQFAQACTLWTTRKGMSLADLLIERGWLTPDDRADVERLVERKLKKNAGDVPASLTTINTDPVKRTLAEVQDPVIQESLAHFSLIDSAGPASTAFAPVAHDRYTLLRLHARGGIGQLWLARDNILGRDVALKELRRDTKQNETIRARFVEEAKITGQLEHPGVVPVYELIPHGQDERPVYTMRFIRGRTLTDAIKAYHGKRVQGKAGPRDLRELLGAYVAVCNTVAYANARSVVHRDLKGQNVVLGDYGEVIVVDWGLAKLVGSTSGNAHEEGSCEQPLSLPPGDSRNLTMQGQVLGTPSYMAPEQAAGRADLIGTRTDVYGLGAILYEILTGQPPFLGSNTLELVKRVVHETPANPRQLLPSVSPVLEAICLKALAKDPAGRYATAKELAQDIECCLADEPVSAYPEPWTVRVRRWAGRHRTGVAAAAAAVLMAAVTLGLATVLLTAANQRERDAREEALNQRDQATAANLRERLAREEATRERDAARRQKDRADQNFARARSAVEKYCTSVTENARLKEGDFTGLRKELLQSAVGFYQELVAQKTDDEQLLAEQGDAFYKLGRLRLDLREAKTALDDYQHMRAIFSRLAAQHPKEPRYRLEIGRCYNNEAIVLYDLGRVLEAEQSYRKSIEACEQGARDFPDSPDFHTRLSMAFSNLGGVMRSLGNSKAAMSSYAAAQAQLTQLADAYEKRAKAEPHNADARRIYADAQVKLASNALNFGTMALDEGDLAEAEKSFAAAKRSFERLARESPRTTEYRNKLAWSELNLGKVFGEAGAFAQSQEEFDAAGRRFQQLRNQSPTIPEFRKNLGLCFLYRGDMLQEFGRRSRAAEEYRDARQILEELVKQLPEIPEHKARLADALNGLAKVAQFTGKLPEALGLYERSIGLLTPFQEGAASDLTETLQDAQAGRAAVLFQVGKAADARHAWKRACPSEENLKGSPQRRGLRALALAHAGEHTAALEMVKSVASTGTPLRGCLYDAGSACAVIASATSDPDLAKKCAEVAVQLLRRAAAKHFLDVERLRQDKHWESLRARADVKEIIQELSDLSQHIK